MSDKPRFFCDNCAAEVGRGEKSCPRCGRLFASIRCPSCGFVGGDEAFAGGCPACGYSASAGKARPRASGGKGRKRQSVPSWALFLSICISALAFAILFVTLL